MLFFIWWKLKKVCIFTKTKTKLIKTIEIMKLCKKTNKMKGFWVEDYTEQEKEFFIGLGFAERHVKFMGEWMSGFLSFHGSKSFGYWNDDEAKNIYDAVTKEFGKCKPRLLTTAELM